MLLGELLRRAHLVMAADHRAWLARHGMTPEVWRVCDTLLDFPHGVRVNGLSEMVGLSQPSLTRLVGKMEGEGYVKRHPVRNAGRGVLVRLLPGREAFLALARENAARVEDRLRGKFPMLEELTPKLEILAQYQPRDAPVPWGPQPQ